MNLEPSLGADLGHVGKRPKHFVIAVWTHSSGFPGFRYIAHEKGLLFIEEIAVSLSAGAATAHVGFSSHVQFTHLLQFVLVLVDDCADVAQASQRPVPVARLTSSTRGWLLTVDECDEVVSCSLGAVVEVERVDGVIRWCGVNRWISP